MTPEQQKELERLVDAFGKVQFRCGGYDWGDDGQLNELVLQHNMTRSALIAYVQQLVGAKEQPT